MKVSICKVLLYFMYNLWLSLCHQGNRLNIWIWKVSWNCSSGAETYAGFHHACCRGRNSCFLNWGAFAPPLQMCVFYNMENTIWLGSREGGKVPWKCENEIDFGEIPERQERRPCPKTFLKMKLFTAGVVFAATLFLFFPFIWPVYNLASTACALLHTF